MIQMTVAGIGLAHTSNFNQWEKIIKHIGNYLSVRNFSMQNYVRDW